MKDDPLWQRVIDCFKDGTVDLFRIVQKLEPDPQKAFERAATLNAHLTSLRGVRDADLPAQVVPATAGLSDAIDIFDRVNSQGTKLTDAELALTHITAKWPQARRVMKEKLQSCAERGFDFGLTFMTRALTTTVTRRALFETIRDADGATLRAGWKRLDKMLDYLTTILPQRAYIHATDDLNTTNALVPLIAYLETQGGKFPGDASIKHAVHWLYAALMWARYTAQTDQRLETDVTLSRVKQSLGTCCAHRSSTNAAAWRCSRGILPAEGPLIRCIGRRSSSPRHMAPSTGSMDYRWHRRMGRPTAYRATTFFRRRCSIGTVSAQTTTRIVSWSTKSPIGRS